MMLAKAKAHYNFVQRGQIAFPEGFHSRMKGLGDKDRTAV